MKATCYGAHAMIVGRAKCVYIRRLSRSGQILVKYWASQKQIICILRDIELLCIIICTIRIYTYATLAPLCEWNENLYVYLWIVYVTL